MISTFFHFLGFNTTKIRPFSLSCISLLLLCLVSTPLFAERSVILKQDEIAGMILNPYISIWIDKTGEMTIEEAISLESQGKFTNVVKEHSNFGFSSDTYWVKLTLVNLGPEKGHWYLEVANPLIDKLSLFQIPSSGVMQAYHTGDSKPFHDRKVKNRHFVFPIELQGGHSEDLFFRIQSNDTIDISLLLWSDKSFYVDDHDTQTFIGSYFGIMAMMLVYNLIIYLLVREKVYLYYILAMLSFSLFVMTLTGYAFEYIWPDFPLIAKNSRPFFIGTSIIFIGFFIKSLFSAEKFMPTYDKILNVIMICAGVVSLLAVLGFFQIAIILGVLISLPASLLILLIAIQSVLQGYRPAKAFILGWGFFLIGIIIYSIKALGLIPPYFLVRHGMMIGSIIQVVALASALSERLRLIRYQLEESNEKLLRSRKQIINRLSIAGEFRDNETGLHVVRVSHYAKLLAQAVGLSERDCNTLYDAAPLHDIGKIGIPDAILLKAGRLTAEEIKHMEHHAEIGGKIIGHTESKLLAFAKEIALTHHEKWDGSGYPNGLQQEEISILGRIVAIADVFDALTSVRPYKKAWTVPATIDLLIEEKGKHFDPKFVDLFLQIMPQILEIKEKYSEEEPAPLEPANPTPQVVLPQTEARSSKRS